MFPGLCSVSLPLCTHVKSHEKCQSDYRLPPKITGKILSLVSHPSVDTLCYMKLKSNFINFLWNCSLYRNGHMTYKLHFIQTLFIKMCREIHVLLVLCYSSCWNWGPPICSLIYHWSSNKFCDICWSSSSGLCRITFQISICKSCRACSLFLIYVSWD